jgi:tetratricopeptide (TPR) repeat protein
VLSLFVPALRLLAILIALGMLQPASAAPAAPAAPAAAADAPAPPPGADAEVDWHAALGQRHFERGRYQDAIAEFRRAYELRADPEFLRGIGDSYRQLGIVDRALFFYDRYLAARPSAPDRDDVADKIAELERARAAASSTPRPSLARDVLIAPADAGAPAAPAPSRPIWRRWWFWTAAGALLVAGVTAALTISAGHNETTVPATDLGSKRFY